jgi:hypothetical protein
MTIFRWIIGFLAAIAASGAVLSFVLFILTDVSLWIERARRFRRWTWLVALLWFNTEVWGRVILTLVHWRG